LCRERERGRNKKTAKKKFLGKGGKKKGIQGKRKSVEVRPEEKKRGRNSLRYTNVFE